MVEVKRLSRKKGIEVTFKQTYEATIFNFFLPYLDGINFSTYFNAN